MASFFALHTRRYATIDVLRTDRASVAFQLVGITLFALFTAVGAQFRVYLWEVPITLQTIFVYSSGLFLGGRNGFLSMLMYLALGFFLPVYAGNGQGLDYLLTASSAGYLLGMPVAAAIIGWLSTRWNTVAGSSLSILAGSVTLFGIGVVWLHFAADHATWIESIDKGWARFVLFDACKIVLVSLIYGGTRRWL